MFEITIRENIGNLNWWGFQDQMRFAEFKNAALRAESWVDLLNMQKENGMIEDYEIIISSKEDY